MHRTKLTQAHSYDNSLQRLIMMIGMFSVLVATTLASTMTTYAASIPGGDVANPVVRAVDIAKPAIVRIITSISGTLDVQFQPNQTVTFPQGNTKTYQQSLSGTGTFITANGDILTADHVVSPPPQVLQDAASSDIANYVNQHPETGIGQATASQIDQALITGQLKSTAKYSQKSSEVFLSTDYSGPLSAPTLATLPTVMHATVDQIEKESPFDQMDVAVVHAGFKDTPSVLLGDSSGVQTQDHLTIIGFPGNADINEIPQNLFTSSVNDINVSSMKTTTAGAPLIQVGGNVEHGDSGGPALDSSGTVVGIVSFGLSNANSPGSTSFLQASNSARQLVQALNLNTTPGTFQKLWSQGFTDYASSTPGHWHTTQQEFQQIATSYPQFKALTPYLDYTKTQALTETASPGQPTATTTPQQNNTSSSTKTSTGTSTKPSSSTSWQTSLITIGAIAVIVLLVIVFFAVSISKRKKKPSTASVNGQNPLPAGPPQPQQPGGPARIPTPNFDGMAAFGAPPIRQAGPVPPIAGQPVQAGFPQTVSPNTFAGNSMTLRPWPCGHINRPNARFCTICGEPAPQASPSRRVEQ